MFLWGMEFGGIGLSTSWGPWGCEPLLEFYTHLNCHLRMRQINIFKKIHWGDLIPEIFPSKELELVNYFTHKKKSKKVSPEEEWLKIDLI